MTDHTFSDLSRRDTERHILVAVDESDNSRRAVMYLADFFGDYKDVFVTILSIIPEPSEDYFPTDDEREKWLSGKKTTKILNKAKLILPAQRGLLRRRVQPRVPHPPVRPAPLLHRNLHHPCSMILRSGLTNASGDCAPRLAPVL